MMVLLSNMISSSVWILWWCLMFVEGERLCKSELLIQSDISTELQSDVLLPCNFNPALLGSDKTADIAVVWSQRNITVQHLLEINLQGVVTFWDYKGGRIKTFPKLSESGNFSIVLQKVQLYDLSLYRCELFNGTACSIAYQELQLDIATGFHAWRSIIAGASAGAVLLFLFITCVCIKGNNQTPWLQLENRRESCYTEVTYAVQNSHGRNEYHSINVATGISEEQSRTEETTCEIRL